MSVPRVFVTGMAVRCALGVSVSQFANALRQGAPAVTARLEPRLARSFPVAELPVPAMAGHAAARLLIHSSPGFQSACLAAAEALQFADFRGSGAAILVAGSNLNQATVGQAYERFLDQPRFANPRYAATHLDSTLPGAISAITGLRGPGCTVGAGMASGNAALHQAFSMLRGGGADACLCVGACTEWSGLEFASFANLGVLPSLQPGEDPASACRPFDRHARGFAYGQAAAALLLETEQAAAARNAPRLAELSAVSLRLEGQMGSDPSVEGEENAMRAALDAAGVRAHDVDYVNAHGTGTPAGDQAECEALSRVFSGCAPWINSSKPLFGHTVSAAGILEAAATIVQLMRGFVHPNPNLMDAISPSLRLAGREAVVQQIQTAISNSFSFGGYYSSAVLKGAV